ncbi:redox-sensitive transcriptional activator SoxR [Nitrospirillum pindoramense]|uniref:MerR family redox-sensitive transcriptional activator SoxR n=1 Tax=Nitrospirillum amazonense TaxID=28077 RepID=A0A560GRT7_9PROT|nr:redox-sensitive transcriptional activator SoxR [Nitrospirillum amazonense]TWB36481.1 MerR family redox-sensitive transcriptional activator SoxR [Nitrospirillum amazonense]
MPASAKLKRELSVGEVAKRAGVAVSTLHFYETKGLIVASRSGGNQRRYPRDVLRRIAIIRVAQRAGIALADIHAALATLPNGRTPTLEDWRRLSNGWRDMLQQRIDSLTQLRDQLETCIGCGCLSMGDCPLRNPQDRLAAEAMGPVLLQRSETAPSGK